MWSAEAACGDLNVGVSGALSAYSQCTHALWTIILGDKADCLVLDASQCVDVLLQVEVLHHGSIL